MDMGAVAVARWFRVTGASLTASFNKRTGTFFVRASFPGRNGTTLRSENADLAVAIAEVMKEKTG